MTLACRDLGRAQATADSISEALGTNHLGHFALTYHLLPALKAAPYLTGKGGQYLEDCSVAQIHQSVPASGTGVMHYAVDAEVADQLWQVSLELLSDYL